MAIEIPKNKKKNKQRQQRWMEGCLFLCYFLCNLVPMVKKTCKASVFGWLVLDYSLRLKLSFLVEYLESPHPVHRIMLMMESFWPLIRIFLTSCKGLKIYYYYFLKSYRYDSSLKFILVFQV